MTGFAPHRSRNAAPRRAADDPTVPSLDVPVTFPSRIDGVEARLMAAITLGEYLPGSRLPPERDLAAALGAGRDTVRTALARLVDRGLLVTRRGRGGGSFVAEAAGSGAPVTREVRDMVAGMRDTIDAISRLHATVAEAAAERRTATDTAAMTAALEHYRAAASGRDAQAADARLHQTILTAAHADPLVEMLMALESRTSILAGVHLWGDAETMRDLEPRALRDHEDLVAAIVSGDRALAREVARRHSLIDLDIVDRTLRR